MDLKIEPPLELKREHYLLEVLSPKHNELDWEAWNSSKENLLGIFGPKNNWPNDVADLNSNLKDLENHLREFNEKEAYTYSILDLDKKLCLGCLYIRPTKSAQHDSRVDFWFRDSHKKFENEFFEWLKLWLNNHWQLECVFPGRSITWDEYYQLIGE